jgi:hypothetical protein
VGEPLNSDRSRTPTVVIAYRFGRLANRLVLFAHLIATAEQHGFRVVNPSLAPLHGYFPLLERDLLCRYPTAAGSLPGGDRARLALYVATRGCAAGLRALRGAGLDVGLLRVPQTELVDLDGERFLAEVRRRRVLLIQGWLFRSERNVLVHREAILRFLAPARELERTASEVVERARADGATLVGVHMRRGDYRTHRDGRFYFDDAGYRRLMEHVLDLRDGERVRFLIASDEPVRLESFSGLDVRRAHGHELIDLYTLAGCDWIVGPPSTYSLWASFVGAVPIHFVHDPRDQLDPSDFRPRLELSRALVAPPAGPSAQGPTRPARRRRRAWRRG